MSMMSTERSEEVGAAQRRVAIVSRRAVRVENCILEGQFWVD